MLGACSAAIRPLQPRPGTGAPGAPTPTPAAPVSSADADYFKDNALMVPVVGVGPKDVHDTFNETRDNGGRIHRATDILVPRNTPVLAATPGTILRMSNNALGGITLYLLDDHQRFLYYYAHLDHYSEQVSAGMHVRQGDILGYVGSTGNADSSAPHLHFQAMRWDAHRHDYWNSTPVDVRPFFQLLGQERTE